VICSSIGGGVPGVKMLAVGVAVGGWAGVSRYRGAESSCGRHSAAFVGHAWRHPEGAEGVAADECWACQGLGLASGWWLGAGAARRARGPAMEALWEQPSHR